MLSVDLQGRKVWVAGHRGMVGSALVRRLEQEKCQIITVERQELDLREQRDVRRWMTDVRPNIVFLAAAKVGGILANSMYAADFIYDNLMIEANIIQSSHAACVDKLLFLGSSCIYPKFSDQPIREDALLSGSLESSNEWYAVAKIAGIKLCQAYRQQYDDDFVSAMPSNLYGPEDNYNLATSHVMPALIRKIDNAKRLSSPEVEIWGSGTPLREFLHVDDLADACIFVLKRYSDPVHINIGSGKEISILELAKLIAEVVGYSGQFVTDPSKPDGTPRKVLDVSKLASLGWQANIGLRQGIRDTYAYYLENVASQLC